MNHVYVASTAVAFFLYAAILHLLFRAHLRRYFFLFIYMLVVLFTTMVDARLHYGDAESLWDYPRSEVYFFNDVLRQAMLYLLVISLIVSAVQGSERFRWLGRWLVLGALSAAGLSIWLHHTPRVALWMTNVVRNLSLMAMLMTLLLWSLLLARRTKDRTLLLVVTGLGLQMAGEAMGHSLRLIDQSMEGLGNFVLVLAHLCCLMVWFVALRPRAPKAG